MNEFLLLAIVIIYVAISYRPNRDPKGQRRRSRPLGR
jgi:hypothetical protein